MKSVLHLGSETTRDCLRNAGRLAAFIRFLVRTTSPMLAVETIDALGIRLSAFPSQQYVVSADRCIERGSRPASAAAAAAGIPRAARTKTSIAAGISPHPSNSPWLSFPVLGRY